MTDEPNFTLEPAVDPSSTPVRRKINRMGGVELQPYIDRARVLTEVERTTTMVGLCQKWRVEFNNPQLSTSNIKTILKAAKVALIKPPPQGRKPYQPRPKKAKRSPGIHLRDGSRVPVEYPTLGAAKTEEGKPVVFKLYEDLVAREKIAVLDRRITALLVHLRDTTTDTLAKDKLLEILALNTPSE